MYCTNCGAQNESGTKFCISCGQPMNETLATTDHTEQQAATRPPVEPKTRSKKGRIWLIVILVIVGLGVIGYFANSSDEQKGKKESSSQSDSSVRSSEENKESGSDQSESASGQVSDAPSVDPMVAEAEFKKECNTYTYKEIARNPKNYEGKKAQFEGQVIQVIENNDDVIMRVDITKEKNEFAENGYLYSDTVYVEYTRKSSDESRILEDDIIMMYGTLNGLKSYDTIFGSNETIPYLKAEYVDIISK